MFEAYFGKRWRAVPLGMSGDTVAYLRWRLEHGELPKVKPPRVAVLLVGTNDLRDAKALYEHQAGDGATVEGRSAAVLASSRDIGGRCDSTLLLRGFLIQTKSRFVAGGFTALHASIERFEGLSSLEKL